MWRPSNNDLKRTDMDADQLLQQARAAAGAGDRTKARELLERAVSKYPDSAPAWYLLSQVVDDKEQVINCLEKVLEIEPYSKQAQQRLKRWRSAERSPETVDDKAAPASPEPLALETAEESVGGSTAVAVGAIVLLMVIVGLAIRVGVISIGGPSIPRDQLSYEVYVPGEYSSDRRWPEMTGPAPPDTST